ncbi:MAG TPA: DUF4214 domain-containing protein, partial [Pyrinomonadaceae bacterium]|nr:DUF4214 domain-containing protein [Pyrinomonadaceae bacterium]
MLEIGDPEIKVDRLMHEIREAVARQREGADEAISASATRPAPSAPVGLDPLTLGPGFQPRPDDQYHVNDLLKYHGEDFVRSAYRAILKREPDPAGWAHHLESLAGGRFNKIDVLASLRYSPEGERARVKVNGLAWPAAIRRAGRVPLVGYLIQLAVAVARLPLLVQHQRQSEFHLAAQQQRIADHDHQAHERLAQTLAQVSAQVAAGATEAAARQQAVESWSRRQQDEAARALEFRDAVEARLTSLRGHVDQSAAELSRQADERAAALARRVEESEESAAELAQQVEGEI